MACLPKPLRVVLDRYIRRGKPDAGFPLFESESLKWPGFVEFDDVNSKVLTYSAQDKAYRVWEMTNYELLCAALPPAARRRDDCSQHASLARTARRRPPFAHRGTRPRLSAHHATARPPRLDSRYTLPDDDVTEIKISPGIMLLIHQRQGGYVPLKILSIEDGAPC